MALVPITLKTLGDLDGGYASGIIDARLAAAVADLDDRGTDGKERTVVIKVVLTRMDNGQVLMRLEADFKPPAMRTAATFGRIKRDQSTGKTVLVFSQGAPDNPEQPTLDQYFRDEKEDD